MIDEDKYKQCLKNIKLEDHCEMIKCAYYFDIKDKDGKTLFSQLIETGLFRCENRRIEVPFITDIIFKDSDHIEPERPNGYELIQQDLNEAHLETLLSKLRNNKQ